MILDPQDLIDSGIIDSVDQPDQHAVAMSFALRDAEHEVEQALGRTLATQEHSEFLDFSFRRGRWVAYPTHYPVTAAVGDDLTAEGRTIESEDEPDTDARVTYTAGYTHETLPPVLKRAIMMLAGYYLVSQGNGTIFSRKTVQLPGGAFTAEGVRPGFKDEVLATLTNQRTIAA